MSKWYDLALAELGQSEIQGSETNPRILEYLDVAGFPDVQNDEDAWCSVFANWALVSAGQPGTHSRMAKSFLGYGKKLSKPQKACIVVLDRTDNPSLGHVGFFSHEKDGMVYVLGGNQSNKVSIAPFPKSRVREYRMPSDRVKLDRKVLGTGAASGGAIVSNIPTIPAPPDLSQWTAWQGFGESVSSLLSWIPANPLASTIAACWISAALFWPQIKGGLEWVRGAR